MMMHAGLQSRMVWYGMVWYGMVWYGMAIGAHNNVTLKAQVRKMGPNEDRTKHVPRAVMSTVRQTIPLLWTHYC